MMKKNNFRIILYTLFLGSLFYGCEKWDDHNALTDPKTGKDLFQQIQENPELSSFAELLVKSGYDKVIASSQNYTVFAPVNNALASLDPAIANDDTRLRQFIANHISSGVQPVNADSSVRLQMMSGKYNNLHGTHLEAATITEFNHYGKNGLLHIIDAMAPAWPSAWEFLQNDADMPAHQKSFMLANKDSLGNNDFFMNVYDLRDEKKQFTFFVMADAGWDEEVDKYKPFFITGTADSTTNMASRAIVNDLAVEGVYEPAAIPDTIVSKFNTKVGIDKDAIVRTVKLSNGIVYIMNKLEVLPRHKFQPYILQGENFSFSRVDRRNNIYIREKINPVTGEMYKDVLVWDHNVAQFYLGYQVQNVPAINYKAYWVAVQDSINNSTGTFKQLLGIGTSTSTDLPYITVQPKVYTEIYLGEFTRPVFSPTLDIFLTADNSTNDDANKITVDYIRLEPVL